MNTLVREISAIQADMICMEGMLEALVKGAYAGARVEYIGNSLEILKDYLGRRADQLDMVSFPLVEMQKKGDAAARKILSDRCSRWEEVSADTQNTTQQSKKVDVAYQRFFPYLKELPEGQQEALYLAAKDVETTFRKQGFMEGFMAAVDWICGEENVNE